MDGTNYRRVGIQVGHRILKAVPDGQRIRTLLLYWLLMCRPPHGQGSGQTNLGRPRKFLLTIFPLFTWQRRDFSLISQFFTWAGIGQAQKIFPGVPSTLNSPDLETMEELFVKVGISVKH